jgi:hypothetical protein
MEREGLESWVVLCFLAPCLRLPTLYSLAYIYIHCHIALVNYLFGYNVLSPA